MVSTSIPMGAVYISLVSICSMLYNAVDIHTAGDNKYIH